MRKLDELILPDSCFNKAADDDLLFVLIQKDPAAPATIRFWIEERIRLGLNAQGDAKLASAESLAHRIELAQKYPGAVDGEG